MPIRPKAIQIITSLFLALFILACAEEKKYGPPNVAVDELKGDYNKWYNYQYRYIDLTANFSALDEHSNDISKIDFLEKLTSGKFIPIKMNAAKSSLYYKLFPIDEKSQKQISTSMRSLASMQFVNAGHLGKNYPRFSFQDIEGNTYDSKQLSGKHLVIKYWFINCKPCVAEMPEFEFVKNKYQNLDVNFISMAFDDPDELNEFFEDKEYKIPTISVSQNYISDSIGIKYYPTHLLLNEEGKIVSVTNDMKHLRRRLKDFVD
ncbi:TlpA family protein disulfide reductase [Gramella sp. GC03-9]|uniref:TlpA family protein disulfide reductase n=1 Tax=Christiangramia oceanisediminis TaxID=2920386 RepID=A0A9X2I707_9FLAO|nr:TlpA disulfide reductase family protein [Gramella oceanisediminis]MCP9198849.1 TlpA family protein disulfide reductase [Gramella oceanisediminis]